MQSQWHDNLELTDLIFGRLIGSFHRLLLLDAQICYFGQQLRYSQTIDQQHAHEKAVRVDRRGRGRWRARNHQYHARTTGVEQEEKASKQRPPPAAVVATALSHGILRAFLDVVDRLRFGIELAVVEDATAAAARVVVVTAGLAPSTINAITTTNDDQQQNQSKPKSSSTKDRARHGRCLDSSGDGDAGPKNCLAHELSQQRHVLYVPTGP
jgi:hypothetical protein